jgi:hypothetical protein
MCKTLTYIHIQKWKREYFITENELNKKVSWTLTVVEVITIKRLVRKSYCKFWNCGSFSGKFREHGYIIF